MLSLPVMRAASVVARTVPPAVAAPAAAVGARVAARLSGDQRKVVERNLRRAAGRELSRRELSRGVDAVFDSYAHYWLDSLRLPSMDAASIDRGFSVDGLALVESMLDAGTPPILALPHLGGWEWAAAWMTRVRGWPVAAVAERLEPPELFDWFVEFRRSLGVEVIATGPSAGAEVAAAIAGGSLVCLLSDRDLTGDGVEVEFFGERTTLPGGPALLALRTGAPLVPVGVYYRDGGCHGVVLDPLDTQRRGRLRQDVTRVTQDLAAALEELIRRAPEQWHLLQPNWPSDYAALGRTPPSDVP